MSNIIIWTQAYNAEKTLSRAVDSILSQTYGDFTYYLLDNGSTDKTHELIQAYAEKDKRIIPLHNRQNNVWESDDVVNMMSKIDDNCYHCTLDADDEYYPHFLEYSMNFMNKNQLDIAICGNDFIDAASGRFMGARKLETDLILEDALYDENFPCYHQFMRTVWGKLSKFSVVREWDLDVPAGLYYGNDTIMIQTAFRRAKRVGILAGTLHKYYYSTKSISHRFHDMRVASDRILDDATRKFLIDKCGMVSPRNDRFLQLVYFNAIKDTLTVLLNSNLPSREKLHNLHDMFTHEKTQELFRQRGVPENDLTSGLCTPTTNWILSQKESRTNKDSVKETAEIFMSMDENLSQIIAPDGLKYIISKMPEMVLYLLQGDYVRILERLRSWFKRHSADIPELTELEISACRVLGKTDDELFILFKEIKKNRPQASKMLDIDAQIHKLIEKYPLLKNMSADLTSSFPRAVCWVIKSSYAKALDAFISVQDVEINDVDTEAYIIFGQNLSAAADNTDAFIYFKKVWISYLLDHSRVGEASKELDEFEQILPDDEDFIELRKRLRR